MSTSTAHTATSAAFCDQPHKSHTYSVTLFGHTGVIYLSVGENSMSVTQVVSMFGVCLGDRHTGQVAPEWLSHAQRLLLKSDNNLKLLLLLLPPLPPLPLLYYFGSNSGPCHARQVLYQDFS